MKSAEELERDMAECMLEDRIEENPYAVLGDYAENDICDLFNAAYARLTPPYRDQAEQVVVDIFDRLKTQYIRDHIDSAIQEVREGLVDARVDQQIDDRKG